MDPARRTKARGISRRGLIQGALGGTAAALAAGFTTRSARAAAMPPSGPPTPFDWERFLVERITMGFTLPEFLRAKQIGYAAYLDEQLKPTAIDDSALESLLAAEFPSLALDPYALYDRYGRNGTEGICVAELRAATVLRATFSKRQLKERLVDLWSNHFSLDHKKVLIMATTDHREVIRTHAMKSFPELLQASAHSAAMLCFLDNGANLKEAPNENYARELMELHTMGVRSGYTEQDVKEVARCLTGWSWVQPTYYGSFAFYGFNHDDDAKSVLGHSIAPGGGQSDGEWVLRELGRRRETSQFIARKVLRHFFGYAPSDRFVDRVARVFRQTDGDVKELVRAVFSQDNVTDEGIGAVAKIKRPGHYITSLLRALDVGVDKDSWTPNRGDWIVLYTYLLGQMPFDHITPEGYPDDFDVWSHAMLPRWRFASDLLENRIPSSPVDFSKLEGMVGTFQPDTTPDQIDLLLTGGRMSAEDKAEIAQFVSHARVFDERIVREAIALGAQSPSFQLY